MSNIDSEVCLLSEDDIWFLCCFFLRIYSPGSVLSSMEITKYINLGALYGMKHCLASRDIPVSSKFTLPTTLVAAERS